MPVARKGAANKKNQKLAVQGHLLSNQIAPDGDSTAKPPLPPSELLGMPSHVDMANVKSEFNKLMKELGIYFLWVASFSLMILLTRDGTMTFQFSNLFRAALITDPGYDNLVTIDNFWVFLQEGVGLILAEDIFAKSGDTFFAAEKSFLYGNKRVGSLRIRQVRSPPADCSKFYINKLVGTSATQNKKEGIQCYPEFSSRGLEKEFKKEGNYSVIELGEQPWFEFWEAQEIKEMSSFSATFNSYPGSGFYLDLHSAWWIMDEGGEPDLLMEIVPQAKNKTKLEMMNVTMSQLKESKWIDLKTRAIFVDFSFYNPNMNIFLVARIVVEFLPSGIVSTFPTFRTVDPFRFGTSSSKEILVVVLFTVYAAMAIYFAQHEVISIYRNVYKYFSKFWNIVTFSLVIANLFLIGVTCFTIVETRKVFDNISATPDQGSLQALGFLLDTEKNFSGIVIVIMVIRLYKFCVASRALSTLTRTLEKSAKFVLILVVLFLIAAFGFAQSTTLILGQDNAVFSSTAKAMFTLLRAGFGDFDYTEWPTGLGQILLVSWLLFSNSFLLNIVVAVICEAFVNVTEENREAEEAGETNLVDAVWDMGPVRKLMALQQAQLAKMNRLEATLKDADIDGDGRTDMKELEGWLQESDAAELLGVADATELMRKFDKDGTGTLETKELEKLKAYVRDRRAQLEAEMLEPVAIVDVDVPTAQANAVMQASAAFQVTLNKRMDKMENHLEQLTMMMQSVIEVGNRVPSASVEVLGGSRKLSDPPASPRETRPNEKSRQGSESAGQGILSRGMQKGGGPQTTSLSPAIGAKSVRRAGYGGETSKMSASRLVTSSEFSDDSS